MKMDPKGGWSGLEVSVRKRAQVSSGEEHHRSTVDRGLESFQRDEKIGRARKAFKRRLCRSLELATTNLGRDCRTSSGAVYRPNWS